MTTTTTHQLWRRVVASFTIVASVCAVSMLFNAFLPTILLYQASFLLRGSPVSSSASILYHSSFAASDNSEKRSKATPSSSETMRSSPIGSDASLHSIKSPLYKSVTVEGVHGRRVQKTSSNKSQKGSCAKGKSGKSLKYSSSTVQTSGNKKSKSPGFKGASKGSTLKSKSGKKTKASLKGKNGRSSTKGKNGCSTKKGQNGFSSKKGKNGCSSKKGENGCLSKKKKNGRWSTKGNCAHSRKSESYKVGGMSKSSYPSNVPEEPSKTGVYEHIDQCYKQCAGENELSVRPFVLGDSSDGLSGSPEDNCCAGGISFLEVQLGGTSQLGTVTSDHELAMSIASDNSSGSVTDVSCPDLNSGATNSFCEDSNGIEVACPSVKFVSCDDECLEEDSKKVCSNVSDYHTSFEIQERICFGAWDDTNHKFVFDRQLPDSVTLFFVGLNSQTISTVKLYTCCSEPLYPPYAQMFTSSCETTGPFVLNDASEGVIEGPFLVFKDGISVDYFAASTAYSRQPNPFDFRFSQCKCVCDSNSISPGPPPETTTTVSATTKTPTNGPTSSPTNEPTRNPTSPPTNKPTSSPTNEPTRNPTSPPTNKPTSSPTNKPTNQPTISPTHYPTNYPTHYPTSYPTTDAPTKKPTNAPVTNAPTDSPTNEPTSAPSSYPTNPPSNDTSTVAPTNVPTSSLESSSQGTCSEACDNWVYQNCIFLQDDASSPTTPCKIPQEVNDPFGRMLSDLSLVSRKKNTTQLSVSEKISYHDEMAALYKRLLLAMK